VYATLSVRYRIGGAQQKSPRARRAFLAIDARL